jgi:hypothetical protein
MCPRIRSFAKPSRATAVLIAAAAAGASLAALPPTALAGRFDTHRGSDHREYRHDGRNDDRHHDHDGHRDGDQRPRGHLDIHIGAGGPPVICPPPPRVVEERVWVESVCRIVVDRVWAEPVYRTVIDRVWIEPVVRTIPDRKWLPDRYECRDVVRYDRFGRRSTCREYVLVERGHFVDCPRDVIITPGRFEERPRQELISGGRWDTVERQELVCAGHWETRLVEAHAAPPAPRPYEGPFTRIDLRLPLPR